MSEALDLEPVFMRGRSGWTCAIYGRGYVSLKDENGKHLSSHYEGKRADTQEKCVRFYESDGWVKIENPGGVWL